MKVAYWLSLLEEVMLSFSLPLHPLQSLQIHGNKLGSSLSCSHAPVILHNCVWGRVIHNSFFKEVYCIYFLHIVFLSLKYIVETDITPFISFNRLVLSFLSVLVWVLSVRNSASRMSSWVSLWGLFPKWSQFPGQ